MHQLDLPGVCPGPSQHAARKVGPWSPAALVPAQAPPTGSRLPSLPPGLVSLFWAGFLPCFLPCPSSQAFLQPYVVGRALVCARLCSRHWGTHRRDPEVENVSPCLMSVSSEPFFQRAGSWQAGAPLVCQPVLSGHLGLDESSPRVCRGRRQS